MDLSQKIVWNGYSTLAGLIAAIVTKKAVDSAWTFVTGEEPPEPNNPETPTTHAAIWVLAMAAGVGLSQVLVNRFIAERWEKHTGEASPIRQVNLKL
ncbi:MAG: DUF4235 domain-containing protein [Propionibacteriaceae bacterium]|nr:DUF4235 domain-containing protein [Propionibacteriaceae bacterium]